MSPEAFDAACRALPGVIMTVQWGGEHVYKVGGRMFAVLGHERRGASMKVSDIAFEALIETGLARPAPYLARARWVAFADIADLDEADASGWIANAHALVAAKLTRAARREIGL